MEASKLDFSPLLGKKLLNIEMEQDKELQKSTGSVYEKITFQFEESLLIISPIIDSDEIDASIIDGVLSTGKNSIFSQFIGQQLTCTWLGIENKGYNDVLLLSFRYLKPQIMILCNFGSLELYLINRI